MFAQHFLNAAEIVTIEQFLNRYRPNALGAFSMDPKNLDLKNQNIGDEGAIILAGILFGNRTLTTLNLRYTNIGAHGVGVLAKALVYTNLTHLDFGRNNIGDAGAISFAAFLTENKTLISLDLSNNDIGAKGIRVLVGALVGNATLATFYIGGNNFGVEGVRVLATLIENTALTNIDFRASL